MRAERRHGGPGAASSPWLTAEDREGAAPSLTTADGRVCNDCSLTPLVGTGDRVGALLHAVWPAVGGAQADAACRLRPRRASDIP